MTATKMTLTARSPEDVLAMVPVVLGFVPEDSLVMLTFGAPHAFHARVDLPTEARDLPGLVAALLEPAVRHGVRRVLLVAYTEDVPLAERVTGRVREAFEGRSIEVLGRIAADGRRWWQLPRRPREPGVPYDVSAHPFAAEAVVRGLVTHGSRADLSATLAPDPAAVTQVERSLAAGPRRIPARQRVAEAAWAAALVRRCVTSQTTLQAGPTARLLVGLRDLTVRDAAWLTMRRADAGEHLSFWTDVVRRTPTSHIAPPAAILGFAAWLTGQGALAWCAVDRSLAGDPDYRLAGLLADGLTGAMPPSTWDSMRTQTH
ncbi:MAG: DUF4192 domain-containing protein [Nocardioides sp.]